MEAYARAAELDPSFKEPLDNISKLTEEQQALNRDDRRKQTGDTSVSQCRAQRSLGRIGKAGGINPHFRQRRQK